MAATFFFPTARRIRSSATEPEHSSAITASFAARATIGDGSLRLYNSPVGRINANQAVGLTIVADADAVAAGAENTNYNAGTVATSGSGGLTIDGAFNNAGILEALGTGALTINGENLDDRPRRV